MVRVRLWVNVSDKLSKLFTKPVVDTFRTSELLPTVSPATGNTSVSGQSVIVGSVELYF